MDFKMNRKGQITIFVILALAILFVIILIFFVRRPTPSTSITPKDNPYLFVESCTKEAVNEALEKIQKTGGDIKPTLSVMYENVNISYLCYTSNYFQPCVNQKPRLIEHIESQISEYIEPKVEDCFFSLKSSLEKNYRVEVGETSLITRLAPKEVLVEIKKKLKISRDGAETKEFDNFRIKIQHPIYNLAKISSEILNQEAQFCNFDTLGYMTIYPEFNITKTKTGDSDKIYKIMERNSNQYFNFAIKSCPLPPGF